MQMNRGTEWNVGGKHRTAVDAVSRAGAKAKAKAMKCGAALQAN